VSTTEDFNDQTRIPHAAGCDNAVDEAALLVALEEAELDIKGGRLVSHEEMKKRVESWCG
jgi:hypothetical protein